MDDGMMDDGLALKLKSSSGLPRISLPRRSAVASGMPE